VWFALDDDGSLLFNTGEDSVKGRNLRRDARCGICVDDPQPPFSFVAIRGRAELIDDLAEVRRWATVIGGRYMGQENAEAFGARNGVPGELLVRVHADRVTAVADLAE
jgi:PPOX class probable F420-dependent enzyme